MKDLGKFLEGGPCRSIHLYKATKDGLPAFMCILRTKARWDLPKDRELDHGKVSQVEIIEYADTAEQAINKCLSQVLT